MISDSFDLLSEGLARLCGDDSGAEKLIAPRRDVIFSLLTQYITEIEQYNPALSLVGTDDRQELIIRHILDSLAPLGIVSRLLGAGRTVADVGSGAGLPGIPLAIAMPDAAFTLIERKGRRAGFLRHTQEALGLANVAVEEAEMEKAKPGRFALVTFRAFRPLEPKILRGLFRLCSDGGTLAAYKGRREKIEAELAALEEAGKQAIARHIIPCPVPFLDEQRHILCLQKPSK
jgi:16S rRNA (guanine527-N7)-methyltransferase